jgi:N-acetylneuraminic acid mutarotase
MKSKHGRSARVPHPTSEILEPRCLFSTAPTGLSALPIVTIMSNDERAAEPGDDDTAMFKIARHGGDIDQPLLVRVILSGSADNGQDYRERADTVTIQAGKSSQKVTIRAVDDDIIESVESVRMRIGTSRGKYTVGEANAERVTIADDDRAPSSGTAWQITGLIQAEDFDRGGEGRTYHDGNKGNRDHAYRDDTDVEIRPIAGTDDEFAVSRVQPGEWLEYSVNVRSAGTYDLEIRLAAHSGGGTAHVEFGGVDVTGTIHIDETGGWDAFKTIKVKGIHLDAGPQVMRLVADAPRYDGGTNVAHFDYLRVSDHQPTSPLTWSTKTPIPLAREEVNSAVVDGKLYVFGGLTGLDFKATQRVDVYDPAANKWTTKNDMPEAFTHAGVAVVGTDVWFVGGYFGDHPGPGGRPVWIYHTPTDAWSDGPQLPEARGAGAAAIVGRTIHYFGGMDETRTIDESDHWALNLDDIDAGWVARAMVPNARNHLGAAVVNGKIYAIGGEKDGSHDEGDNDEHYRDNQDAVQMYDPATDTWTNVASLPLPASHFHQSTFVWQDHIVLVGGERSHNVPVSDVLAYDPVTDTWEHLTSLPADRRAMGAGIINGKIVAAAGFDGAQKSTVWMSSSLVF